MIDDTEDDEKRGGSIRQKRSIEAADNSQVPEKRRQLEVGLPQSLSNEIRSRNSSSSSLYQVQKPKSPRLLPPSKVERNKQPLPTRKPNGSLIFHDFPEFTPNLTPKEILQLGSFGGTCFQPFTSRITGQSYQDAWKELPEDWLRGLDIPSQLASTVYNPKINRYKVSCGGDLKEWEENGWIADVDPYGWFQWYCRFYLGRRCSDDHRQISRAIGMMGWKGRWRRNLINRCLKSGKSLEEAVHDMSISPKIRQLLQHWGYVLTLNDLQLAAAEDHEENLSTMKSSSSQDISPPQK